MQAENLHDITGTRSIYQHIIFKFIIGPLWCLVEIQLTVNNVCGIHTSVSHVKAQRT